MLDSVPHLLLAATIITAGCDRTTDAIEQSDTPKLNDTFKPADAESAVHASNTFGVNLYRKAAQDFAGGNLFISPYSISVAMAMAAEGAREETLQEMASVLQIPTIISENEGQNRLVAIHAGYAALARHFEAASGDADPQTRKHIQSLRDKLVEADGSAKIKHDLKQYRESQEETARAEKIAAEINALLPTVDRYNLRVANALWIEKTFDLLPSYSQTIDGYYGSGLVTQLDMKGAMEPSRLRINGWVEDHTANRIKDLIPRGGITPDTSLVITNAVYFLGQWSEPFMRNQTRKENFTLAAGNKSPVQMMQDPYRNSLSYAAFAGNGEFFETPSEVPKDEAQRPPTYPDNGGFQMIALPYKGGELSMLLLLPSSPDGISALESKLSAENLDAWIARMTPRTVDVKVPRFKLESEYKLGQLLQSMGMKRAFTRPDQPNGAQFFGMSSSPDPRKQLFIGEVIHKTWVDVNEEGTEAAAATVLYVPATSALMRPIEMIPFTPKFHADRPFIFLIRDAKSGMILFMGRMQIPSA